MDSNGMWTVQSRSNFDDDGAHPVLYLQLVSPVQSMDIFVQSYVQRLYHCHVTKLGWGSLVLASVQSVCALHEHETTQKRSRKYVH